MQTDNGGDGGSATAVSQEVAAILVVLRDHRLIVAIAESMLVSSTSLYSDESESLSTVGDDSIEQRLCAMT